MASEDSPVQGAVNTDERNVIKYYDEWAKNDRYAQDILSEKYNAPAIAAAQFNEVVVDKTARVADFCAGSGLVAAELRTYGFTNLDAIDGSQAMLDLARSNKLYKNYYCELILPDKQTSLQADQYGAMICVGGFVGNGHLKAGTLKEMHRILKKDGLCILSIRREYLINREDYPVLAAEFYPCMQSMVNEGLWKVVQDRTYPDHCDGLDGQMIILKKL